MASSASAFNYKRAITTFLASYIAVEIVCAAVSVITQTLLHETTKTADVHNRAFVATEHFYPLINLALWTLFARIYFKNRSGKFSAAGEAIRLGTAWLITASIFDIIFFILIKEPYSLSFHDFYIGQTPWIYLVYLALFISPLFSVYLWKPRSASKKSPLAS